MNNLIGTVLVVVALVAFIRGEGVIGFGFGVAGLFMVMH